MTGGSVQVTETDTYVVGSESYRVDAEVTNTSTAAVSGVLYRAGDCYLQDSDYGYGIYDSTTGAITCTTSLTPGSRIEQMLPLTPSSSYVEGFYYTMWSDIGTHNPFPNTCDCSTFEDNSLGLSWNFSLGAGANQNYSSIVTFSPLGSEPLTITKTADAASVATGGTDGYTLTVDNPNATAVTLASLTDTLGSGFTYQTGTTTGLTTTDPSVSGQVLTWDNVSVPGSGSATLHFDVTAPGAPGTYYDDAEGTASGYTVVGTGAAAPVTVTGTTTAPTTLKVNAGTGDFADPTSVSAVLTNTTTSAPISGKSVTLKLNSTERCSATTDTTGTATCSITPGEQAGTYTLAGSFLGDSTDAAASGSANFGVTHEQTALSYTGATSVLNGDSLAVSGVLTTDDPAANTALGGKSVTFTLGSGLTAQSCIATTTSTGTASCSISGVNQTVGTVPLSDSFAGDNYYLPASNSASVSVFQPTAVGAFVVGDLSAKSGATVNFWGAQWAKNNSFSGGAAPSSMKGFADSPTSLTCGATWTTRTGNSSAPPATIPGTIEVIVSKKVTQSGSVISGTIAKIVTVQVGTGYGPAPGHPGTGKVIGTVCGL